MHKIERRLKKYYIHTETLRWTQQKAEHWKITEKTAHMKS